MNNEPICIFESQAQFEECLAEWQKRLFLDDWIIKAAVVDHDEMPDTDCDGYNKYFSTNKACRIWISKIMKVESQCIIRHCEELSLVHELLHCKPWLTHYAENEGNAIACYLEQCEHTMLEQMAKSLIMAKYDVDFGWFKA